MSLETEIQAIVESIVKIQNKLLASLHAKNEQISVLVDRVEKLEAVVLNAETNPSVVFALETLKNEIQNLNDLT